jgi:hypothetical protein
MAHVVEVDQSGRIEFTKEDTVLAFANGTRYSILIPSTVKRECVTTLRQMNLPGPNFYLQLFAVGLYLLLKDHIDKIYPIILDYEYEGREPEIKRYLSNLLRREGHTIDANQIQFLHIGKHSAAHLLAIATLRGEEKPNRVITLKEILREFRQ